MKLDRNAAGSPGKYAIVNLRKVPKDSQDIRDAIATLERHGVLEVGGQNGKDADNDFFVIRLRDVYAAEALDAYAHAAAADDPEYASDVGELAHRAANHPDRRRPD